MTMIPISAQIRELTKDTLTQILRFDVSYRVAKYVEANALDDFRAFEELLHAAEYPIRGAGVRLGQADLAKPIHLPETPIAPHQVTSEFNRFPYDATAISYLFTLVELYGEEVAFLRSGAPVKHASTAWHSGVKSDLNLRDPQQVGAQAAKLAAALGVSAAAVNTTVLGKLARMKEVRNDFIHRAMGSASYSRFLNDAIAVIAHIHFLAVPTEQSVVVYPWELDTEDWQDRW